jgi:hypothetical protein
LLCRYENNDAPGTGALMTMNIGAMKSETSGPIGKDNCVELIVPGQIGRCNCARVCVMGAAVSGPPVKKGLDFAECIRICSMSWTFVNDVYMLLRLLAQQARPGYNLCLNCVRASLLL